MRPLRRSLSALFLLLPLSAFALGAQWFDIPAQSLPEALRLYAHQAKMQLIYKSAAVNGGKSNSVLGEFDKHAALEHLLKDTGFEVVFAEGNAATIRPIQSAAEAVTTALTVDESATMRMAQSEDSQSPLVSADGAKDGADEAGVKMEEIVVTAQRRQEQLQDVPISISVLSGADLDKSRSQGLTETLNRVPGVAAPIGALGAPQLVIRGVTSSGLLLVGSSTAGYYLDSVPYGFIRSAIVPDANIYDLERIEVLRGPQGTLFGASAQSGVVRILTHDPSLDGFDLKARASTSSTAEGGWNYRGDLAVNVPLVTDKLAVRAVAGVQDLSGWIDKPARENVNDAEISNFRFKVKARPTENLALVASSWFSRYDAGAQSIGDDNSNNSMRDQEPVDTDSDAHVLRVDYDHEVFSLTSATSYLDYSIASDLDLTLFGPQIIQSAQFTSEVFSQELTFASNAQGAWRWTFGGMYRDVKDRFTRNYDAPFVPPDDYADSSESWAAFGELTRLLFDGRLELTAGLRYFEDAQRLRENISSTGNPAAALVDVRAKFDAVTPRVVATWHPAESLTLYASYSEGFRSGLNQAPDTARNWPDTPALKPDRLHNYEIGSKGSLAGGRVRFDTALYYLDWQKVQQSLILLEAGGQRQGLFNGTSASGIGFEFSAATTPIEGLTLEVNGSWNDLTQDSDVISGGSVLALRGERLVASPEYTAGISADYIFPLGGRLQGQLSAGGNYISQNQVHCNIGGQRLECNGDVILVARTSLAISAPEHWTATLFVDNVNDERDATLITAGFPDWDGRNTRPRTIGLQLDYQF